MESSSVVQSLLERLAPRGRDAASERIWRFSERMSEVYQGQMKQFDEDEETRRWRRLYSAENMPPPSDTLNIADVAAMMAFYSPTNFCKLQKLLTGGKRASDIASMTAESLAAGSPHREDELVEYAEEAQLIENAAQYAKSTADLLAHLPVRNKLLLASELRQRGSAMREFAALLYPSLELSVQWNRVRFYSPQGSYW